MDGYGMDLWGYIYWRICSWIVWLRFVFILIVLLLFCLNVWFQFDQIEYHEKLKNLLPHLPSLLIFFI